MKTPKQKPLSLPKVMYAVVCSENRCERSSFERMFDAYFERDTLDASFSCTHKVVKVSVKKVK